MSVQRERDEEQSVELKDPGLAALLAWLIPGLGHLYQGRTAKGILFSVCILGTFVYGVFLGGRSDLGYGRANYMSFRQGDSRLYFLAQIGVGVPSFPAVIQALRVGRGDSPLWNGFMAPPRIEGDNNPALRNSPTLDTLNYELSTRFELATLYTVIAGLLNILAIYDAWGGPVFLEERKEEEEEPEKQDDTKRPQDADRPPEAGQTGHAGASTEAASS